MPWDSGHTSPMHNHTDCSRNLSFSYSPKYWQSSVDFILCGLNDKSVCLKPISIFLCVCDGARDVPIEKEVSTITWLSQR